MLSLREQWKPQVGTEVLSFPSFPLPCSLLHFFSLKSQNREPTPAFNTQNVSALTGIDARGSSQTCSHSITWAPCSGTGWVQKQQRLLSPCILPACLHPHRLCLIFWWQIVGGQRGALVLRVGNMQGDVSLLAPFSLVAAGGAHKMQHLPHYSVLWVPAALLLVSEWTAAPTKRSLKDLKPATHKPPQPKHRTPTFKCRQVWLKQRETRSGGSRRGIKSTKTERQLEPQLIFKLTSLCWQISHLKKTGPVTAPRLHVDREAIEQRAAGSLRATYITGGPAGCPAAICTSGRRWGGAFMQLVEAQPGPEFPACHCFI